MSKIDFAQLHSWRISIFSETLAILKAQQYPFSGSLVPLPLPNPPISLTVTRESDLPDLQDRERVSPHTEVEIYKGDCLEAGIRLKRSGLNPVVLNMANPVTPGGGVRNGAAAQEENIFRRSAYAYFLYSQQYAIYPIRPTGAIYTPNVSVFRGLEEAGYPLLPQPVSLAFIALPALVRPPLVFKPGVGPWLQDADCSLAQAKLRTCFRLALTQGHDSIVLSAWGCGAFCNPPRCIAALIKEVLMSPGYSNRFRKVVFAIYDDHNTGKRHNPEGNVKPFEEVFGVKAREMGKEAKL